MLRTLSKLGLAGIRLGYLCGDPAWIGEFDKVRPPYNVNVLTLAAADFMLDHLTLLDEQAASCCGASATRLLARAGARCPASTAVRLGGQFHPVPRRGRCRRGRPRVCRLEGSSGILIKNVSRMHPLLANCLRIDGRHRRRERAVCSPRSDRASHHDRTRSAEVVRNTAETQIRVAVNLDGSGASRSLPTGIGFFDHMLDQIARHGAIDLDDRGARATCTSTATTRSRTSASRSARRWPQAIGDKKGIRRYGHAYVPLDEALSRVVIDFSGRPGLEMHVPFTRAMIGEFDVDLVHEFFQGFVNHALVTLHVDNLRGDNAHHQCETVFKAFARALRMAAELDPRAAGGIPSTKGSL
ncbi:MAG: imidazoleglycerol-phosphate dehydratase HisB [Comamonadaceae bacterium]|nr:imidazoleglycerol-phosphate dehydratase HisB [Comamonadaceae bacterium]